MVAICNTSEDTTDLLRIVFENAGFVVLTLFTSELRDGKIDFDHFVREHKPAALVYDIALPYEANWRLFEHVRGLPASRDLAFVVTTTNVAQVRKIAGEHESIHEIVGKPYDLQQLIRRVEEAIARRQHDWRPKSASQS